MMTDYVGSSRAPPTHIPSFTKIGHCGLIREAKVYLWCWWKIGKLCAKWGSPYKLPFQIPVLLLIGSEPS